MGNFFDGDITRCPKCGGIYFETHEFYGLVYYPKEDKFKKTNPTEMIVCKKCREPLDIDLSMVEGIKEK